jgi:hypothetical protein
MSTRLDMAAVQHKHILLKHFLRTLTQHLILLYSLTFKIDTYTLHAYVHYSVQALLSFQDLYVGLTPYTAPAVFSLLQVTLLIIHNTY